MSRIAVLVDEIHPLVEVLADELAGQGAGVSLVSWRDLVVRLGPDGPEIGALDGVRAVYLDRLAEREPCYAAQFELLAEWSRASGVPVLNEPRAYWRSRDKALTAQVLSHAGVPVPETTVCHSVPALRATAHGTSPVAVKSTQGVCAEELVVGNGFELSGDELARILGYDGAALVQPFVHNPERFIWRVDVVDDRAVVINRRYAFNSGEFPVCNGTHGGAIEFLDPARHTSIPPVLLARRAVTALGLTVAGVDIVVDAHGELAVLEVNPEPDITVDPGAPAGSAGFRTEFPAAIARCLMRHARAAREVV